MSDAYLLIDRIGLDIDDIERVIIIEIKNKKAVVDSSGLKSDFLKDKKTYESDYRSSEIRTVGNSKDTLTPDLLAYGRRSKKPIPAIKRPSLPKGSISFVEAKKLYGVPTLHSISRIIDGEKLRTRYKSRVYLTPLGIKVAEVLLNHIDNSSLSSSLSIMPLPPPDHREPR